MTELQFKKLLIESIQIDDNPRKNEVIELLKMVNA